MTGQGLYVTQRLNKLLVTAQDEAKKLKDEHVSVERLVLAMFSEPQPISGKFLRRSISGARNS
jgi:ATP-dependent Clp protease ATP-binding subunit ClpB